MAPDVFVIEIVFSFLVVEADADLFLADGTSSILVALSSLATGAIVGFSVAFGADADIDTTSVEFDTGVFEHGVGVLLAMFTGCFSFC